LEAKVDWSGEPETPRWVEWRLAIYPVALAMGAIAVASNDLFVAVPLFLVFAGLMLAPILIKWRAWGGIGRAIRWVFRSNVKIRKEGFLFVGFVIVFGIAAINTGTNLLYLILAMLLSLMIMSSVLASLNLRGLRVSRRMPGYAFAGESFRIHIVLSNPRRRVPALVIDARERSGPFGEGGATEEGRRLFWWVVEPGERRSIAFTVEGIERRGVYPLEGFTLTTRFPFGFTEQKAAADLPGEVIVFPAPRPLGGEASRALDIAQEVPRRSSFATSPEEFRSLREYRPRDNPRWIHWKSSARAGRLLVKEFEPRASRRAFLVVDAALPDGVDGEAATTMLDRGCTLAVSVLESLARQGERPEVSVLIRARDAAAAGRAGPAPQGVEVARFGPDMSPRETTGFLESLARLVPAFDPGFEHLVEAARAGFRAGARVFVVTARDSREARMALEVSEPGAAHLAQLMGYASPEEVERLYAAATASGGGNGAVKAAAKGLAKGAGTASPRAEARA